MSNKWSNLPWTPLLLVLGPLFGGAGCVQRKLTVRTDPPGALVFLNDQEIGRSPAEQQKPAGEDGVGTDHRLLGLPGEAEVRRDLRQRDEHDVEIEREDQLRERQQRQAPTQSAPSGGGGVR